ncbi:DUF3068 domain-containing protein [Gordonia alkaliphila]|uniref:DUF3068 domain-containing protein n=1 Tax=Gordonia alkaliphila TaxID=1053547 RepID=A0ABP8ZAQ5_9ACTN|nr:DUF3068 domain-containing protein [Gordonia alkaliphila]MCK0438823.1 DUF3068 domain-containing protein [Gordonia alkaliphila]
MPDQHPRLSPRDLLGPGALFLGALLIAVAIAIGPLVGADLKKVPLDLDLTSVSDGSAATRVLDRCSLEAPRAAVVGGTVNQQRRIVTVQPSDARVVTLQAGTALGLVGDAADHCGEPTLAAVIDRTTLDRTTAAPTGSSQVQYDDERAALAVDDRRGYTYVLPFGFDPVGAQYFDPITRQTLPMAAAGSETMGGRAVTRFVVDVPDTDLAVAQQDPRAVLEKPASWFGAFPNTAPNERLTATLHHRATRDLFVDTETGVIVSERAVITEEYRFAPDVRARNAALEEFALTNLTTTLSSDHQTLRDAAAYASSRAWPVTVTTRVVPIVAGGLGVAALITGVWWMRRRPAAAPAAD